MYAISTSNQSAVYDAENSPYRTARMARNISVAEAASKLGVSASTLYAYEQGKAFPSAIILRNMALVYRTSADDLLGLGSTP